MLLLKTDYSLIYKCESNLSFGFLRLKLSYYLKSFFESDDHVFKIIRKLIKTFQFFVFLESAFSVPETPKT